MSPLQVYHLIFVIQDCVVTCGDMIIHKCRNLGYLGRNLVYLLVQCLCCCRLPPASLVKPLKSHLGPKRLVLSYGLDGPCHQIQDTVLKNPLSSPLSLVPAIVPGSRQVGSSQGIGGVRSPGTEFHSWPTPMMLT